MLLPLRGWDALNFYLPNALGFYLSDTIPIGYNYLTYFPYFKAPVNSLVVTYSLFLTGQMASNIYPIIFIILTSHLLLRILKKHGYDKEIQYVVVSLFLLSPFIYFTILEFAYYQDLILGYYYSFTLFYFIEVKNQKYQPFILSLAASMAILSKISGYTVVIVILLLYVKNNNNEWQYKISTTLIYGFLALQLLKNGPSVLIIGIIVLYLITLNLNKIPVNQNNKFSLISLMKSISLPIIIGLIWIMRLNQYPRIISNLSDLYLEIKPLTINLFHYKRIIQNTYLENNYNNHPLTILGIIFLNYSFIPTLLVFKIQGLIELIKKFPSYFVWLSLFFSFWLSYHSLESMRYLFPIAVPLFLIIGLGITKILGQNIKSPLIYLILLIQPILFYYPIVPISGIFDPFQLRFYNSGIHIVKNLIYVVLFIIFTKWIIQYDFKKKKKTLKIVNGFLLIFIVIVPSSYQTGVYINSGFNLLESQNYYTYDNRKSINDLINFIDLEFKQSKIAGIGYNIPGVALKSRVPIIDIQTANNITDQFGGSDATNWYQELNENDIGFIITFTSSNDLYENIQEKYNDFPILIQPSNYTSLIFINSDYYVWRII